MKCSIVKPNTTTYNMRFNKEEDPDMYWRCMWARITLDHDNFTLSAVSDCGNYSYSWQVTESESFIDLMKRINDDYLLDKISDRTVFKLEESKKETIANIKLCFDSDFSSKKMDEIIKEVEEIQESSEESFYRAVDEISDINDAYELVSSVKDYPEGAKVFCRIFKEYLQPLIRRQK